MQAQGLVTHSPLRMAASSQCRGSYEGQPHVSSPILLLQVIGCQDLLSQSQLKDILPCPQRPLNFPSEIHLMEGIGQALAVGVMCLGHDSSLALVMLCSRNTGNCVSCSKKVTWVQIKADDQVKLLVHGDCIYLSLSSLIPSSSGDSPEKTCTAGR